MESNIIEVRQRTEYGKGMARKLRREGRIPAIAYAGGDAPVHIDLNPKDLLQMLRRKGRNTLMQLKVDTGGDDLMVMIKDIQRHPVTSSPLHADFLQIDVSQPVTREIPLNFVGRPIGMQYGGIADVVRRTIEMSMLPADIPLQVDVDVTKLDLGDALHIGDVELPPGCSISEETEKYTILTISAPKAEAAPSDEEDEEAEAEEA